MRKNLQLVAFTTVAGREISRFFRIWKQTLIPPVITQGMYFLVFGGFIGSQIREINGIPYMQFIIPGLVMMSVITSSFMGVAFGFYSTKFQKSVEEMLVSPMKMWVMLSGYVAGGVIRGMLTGLVVFIVSFVFVRPSVAEPWAFIFFALLTSILFSIGGFLNAIFAKTFDDVSIFTTFALTPLIYLGGVFYPVTALPDTWQKISVLNPIVYMVDGVRYGVTGVSEFSLTLDAGILIGLIAIVTIVTNQILRKGAGLKT